MVKNVGFFKRMQRVATMMATLSKIRFILAKIITSPKTLLCTLLDVSKRRLVFSTFKTLMAFWECRLVSLLVVEMGLNLFIKHFMTVVSLSPSVLASVLAKMEVMSS